MEIYIVLPTFGPTCTAHGVLEAARVAEGLGFHGVASTDHLFVPPGPQGEPDRYERVFDVLMVLAAVAPITERVKLMTSVVVLPMRNPFVVAKQAVTIDHFSDGRLVLGLGAGYRAEEFLNVGAEFKTRGKRLDEAIRLFHHLFSGSHEPFAGAFYPYEHGAFGPLPIHKEGLPILIGGNSDAALRRAAAVGNLWQSNPTVSAEQFPERSRTLAELAVGRKVAPGARIHLSGEVEEMREKTRAYAAAGAEHLTVEFFPFDDFDAKLRTYAREVRSMLLQT